MVWEGVSGEVFEVRVSHSWRIRILTVQNAFSDHKKAILPVSVKSSLNYRNLTK